MTRQAIPLPALCSRYWRELISGYEYEPSTLRLGAELAPRLTAIGAVAPHGYLVLGGWAYQVVDGRAVVHEAGKVTS